MAFHRLTVPSYTGGLPGGYDYINNATSGTPAPADGALGAGVYSGSYFFALGGQITASGLNRAAQALAENCDYLDDLLRRDIAVPTMADFAGDPGGVSSATLTGPGVYIGKVGTTNDAAGIATFVQLVDTDGNAISDGTNECVVTSITGGTPGDGFSTGDITLNISPAIPANTAFRVVYAVRSNLAALPVDALTNIVIRSSEEVPADLMAPGGAGLIGAGAVAGSPYALATLDVAGQLNELLGHVNDAAADISTNTSNIATNTADIATNTSDIATNTSNITVLINRGYVDVREPGLRLSSHATDSISELSNLSGTLYYHPYKSGRVDLFDGTGWVPRVTNTVISLSLTGIVAQATSYDVFAYWTGSAIALELVAFNTDRALRDGVLVKGSDHTRRYIGSVRGYADAANQIFDAATDRSVWNMYNQVRRHLRRTESTSFWTYNSTTWRLANNITNNRVRLILGVKQPVYVRVHTIAYGSDASNSTGWGCPVGIGLNSTTLNFANVYGSLGNHNLYMSTEAVYNDVPSSGPGWYTFNWLERTGGREFRFHGSIDGSGEWGALGISGHVMG